ncbi:amidohydrolase family protein [Paenibacillus sp. GCM10012307]|uniref:Amidohydrolase family protein n=1 Tax=Paenibacillus roseus TaxID=2798579 RepID=A0A934MLM2_9BACL|nr:amidohydrolase family protein [Paenibacillus roseus]MBJ6362350.1 amidohydrolase family protein [Paenibacillus roseus]
MRIDAHQHYWKVSRGDYGWLTPELSLLYRDYLPEDLRPHLRKHGLDKTIVVQAAQTLEETDYLLELSSAEDTIAGVVGWLDLNNPNYQDHYERFSRHPKFVGFRIMIQEMANAQDILQPHFVEAVRYFAERDIPVDLLVLSHQLDPLVKLLEQAPGLRGVIDHIAKPKIAAGELLPWKEQMAVIASHPKLYCKLSGMVTEADHQQWKPEDFTAYIRHVLELFGPQRLMFGSDWPVCLLAASYDETMDVLQLALPDELSAADKERLFGGTAAEFYKL